MICITIWIFRFFLFCKPANPKNARTIALLRTENAMWIPHPAQNPQPFRAFCISSRRDIPGETSSSRVRRRRGLLLLMRRNRHCFFEPKCRPLRCSSSGYRGAIGLPLVGPDRVDPSLRFGRYGRTLWESCSNQPNFAISCQLSKVIRSIVASRRRKAD